MLDIMKEYEETRELHRQELDLKKKKLYSLYPRLSQIENEIAKISIEISRSILNNINNRDDLLKSLEKKQLDLKIERAEILSSNKYPMDYLELKYKCKKCKDTGYVDNVKCTCLIQKLITHSYKQSNLSEVVKYENFDEFRFEYYSQDNNGRPISPRKNIEEIYSKCINFVQKFDEHNSNLLFIGKTGLGKTFLCNSIAKDLLDKGKTVIYQPSSDLIDMLRKYKFDFENQIENIPHLENIYNCDLLIIDDLGTELSTQFSNQVIYYIINKRLLLKKKIIISTNLDVDEIVKVYSDRITSRLFGNFDIYEFFGEDIRLKMHKII